MERLSIQSSGRSKLLYRNNPSGRINSRVSCANERKEEENGVPRAYILQRRMQFTGFVSPVRLPITVTTGDGFCLAIRSAYRRTELCSSSIYLHWKKGPCPGNTRVVHFTERTIIVQLKAEVPLETIERL